ncbi:MAG: PAS domain S-box protein, partial [Acidobacteriota bacterium]
KQAEAEARQSDEWFQAVFEQAGIGMALRGVDPRNPRWLRVNQKLCDILGYTREELLQLTSVDVTPPDERDVAIGYNEKLLRGEFTSFSREKRYLRKDGRIVWANITLTPVPGPDGRPSHLISVIEDVSERKRAEAERAQLAAIVESSQDAIVGRTLDGTITSWNAGAERIFGYTRLEALGRHITMLIPPERRGVFDVNQKLLEEGRGRPPFESIQLTKDGRRIPVSVSVSPIRDAQGQVMGVSIIVNDISERKRAEAERAQLAAIVESSQDAIISRGLDGTILSWNTGAERLYGYTAAEAIGRDLRLVPPDRRREVADIRDLIRLGKSVPNHETVRIAKDGRRIDISHSASPLRDNSGNIIGMAVIAHDITARVEAEKQFRLSAAVFESTQEGILVTDAANRIVLVNPAFTRITGYTPDEVIGKSPNTLSSGMHDEAFYKAMWASINDTGRWQGEVWDRRKNGEMYCEWLSISTVKNAQGKTLYHAAIFSDITKQKQGEQNRANLAAIVENSGDAIISRGLDRRISTWNAAAERMFGYTAAEVIGQPTALLIPPEYEAQAAKKQASHDYSCPIPAYDSIRLTKDGRRIYVSIAQSPIKDSNGKLTGVSIAFRDISERKR